jgi:hypothetical protein
MVNLSPRLGPGAHAGVAPAGEIHPQARLADGRRLDAAIGGYRFALLGPQALVEGIAADDVAVLPSAGEHGVLLRPDRYIAGIARSRADAQALVDTYARSQPALQGG